MSRISTPAIALTVFSNIKMHSSKLSVMNVFVKLRLEKAILWMIFVAKIFLIIKDHSLTHSLTSDLVCMKAIFEKQILILKS